MNRLDLATHILATIRADRKFEVSRTAFALAIAASGPAGATAREIASRLREADSSAIGGQLNRLLESAVIRRDPDARPVRFQLTPKGEALVARMLSPLAAKA
jgi:DNA-binding MarR family transcriptional regulator